MAFHNFRVAKASFLKMVVNIAGVYEIVPLHLVFAQPEQVMEPLMRVCFLIHIESMSVEKPELSRVTLEEGRICSIRKAHVSLLEEGISLPETLFPSEGCKSRIMTNARSCCDKQCITLIDTIGGIIDEMFI